MKSKVALAAVALAVMSTLGVPALATTTPTVDVFGDSMQTQAYKYIWFDIQQMTTPPKLVSHMWPGTAICDWLSRMQTDATTLHPVAVLLTFVGNNSTPCISAAQATSPAAVAAQYGADLTTAINYFMNNGTKYVFVDTGPTEPASIETYAGLVRTAQEKAVAALKNPDVKWVNSGASVNQPSTGAFSLLRPCVAYEVAHQLCSGPVINHVANNYVRITDGHFCTWPTPRGIFCPGGWRFANAEATALMNAFKWKPLPPTGLLGVQ